MTDTLHEDVAISADNHGDLPGGSLHDDATTGVSGFMSGPDKQILDDLSEVARVGAGLTEVVTSGAVSVVKEHSDLSIDGTKAFTLAGGSKLGQRKVVSVSDAINTPAGTITGSFLKGGVAKTTALFGATTAFLQLSWSGATWIVEYAVGITFG